MEIAAVKYSTFLLLLLLFTIDPISCAYLESKRINICVSYYRTASNGRGHFRREILS